MQNSSLPQGVKPLMSWSEKGCMTFDNPVRRAGPQWNLLQKSLLIQSMLADYTVPAVYLLKSKIEDATDEEVEEVLYRLNNSTPLSPIQKCRRKADLEVLLQAMLLPDSRHEGYDDWKGISTAEVTKYCGHIRGTYALENEIAPDRFKAFLDSFSNSVYTAYEADTGSGNVKRTKTEGSLSAIANAFAEYFHLGDIHILNITGGIDTGCGEKADAENSEVTDAPASTEEGTPSEEEKYDKTAEAETALETEDLESGRDSIEEEACVNEESA